MCLLIPFQLLCVEQTFVSEQILPGNEETCGGHAPDLLVVHQGNIQRGITRVHSVEKLEEEFEQGPWEHSGVDILLVGGSLCAGERVIACMYEHGNGQQLASDRQI